jgi:hypothetical protein
MSERDEQLLWLHMQYVNMCAEGILTEAEHGILEDALERVTEVGEDV